jgi:hypothetical protein
MPGPGRKSETEVEHEIQALHEVASLAEWKRPAKNNASIACDRDHRLQAEWKDSMQRMK